MENRKIAIACSIAGIVCYALAALFAPQYVWLGTLGGLAAGYLSYEFREVLRAVPKAFRATTETIGGISLSIWGTIDRWTASSHPFLYGGLLASAVAMHYIIPLLAYQGNGDSLPLVMIRLHATAIVGFLFLFTMFSFVLLFLVAWGKREDEELFIEDIVRHKEQVSYMDVLRYGVLGLFFALISFLEWALRSILVVFLFPWKLFMLIHSDKRLLCAVDGTLGGVASFMLCYAPGLAFPEHALATVFGGLIGAVLGVLNWELISVRWLKVESMSKT